MTAPVVSLTTPAIATWALTVSAARMTAAHAITMDAIRRMFPPGLVSGTVAACRGLSRAKLHVPGGMAYRPVGRRRKLGVCRAAPGARLRKARSAGRCADSALRFDEMPESDRSR